MALSTPQTPAPTTTPLKKPNTLGYQDWATQAGLATAEGPSLEGLRGFQNYLQSAYLEAGQWTPEIDKEITTGTWVSAAQNGLLPDPDENPDAAAAAKEALSTTPRTTDDQVRLVRRAGAIRGLQDTSFQDVFSEYSAYRDYIAANPASPEFTARAEELTGAASGLLRDGSLEVAAKRQMVHDQGLYIASIQDPDAPGEIRFEFGNNETDAPLQERLHASLLAGLLRPEDVPAAYAYAQIDPSTGKPYYELMRNQDHVDLLQTAAKSDPLVAYRLENIAKSYAPGAEPLDPQELSQLSASLEAGGWVPPGGATDPTNVALDYGYQTALQRGDIPVDYDNPKNNIHIGATGQPFMVPAAVVNRKLFDEALTAHDELTESQKKLLEDTRDANLKGLFPEYDKILLDAPGGKGLEWAKYRDSQRAAKVPDAKILESWIDNPENFSEFALRAKGVGRSIIDGFGELGAAIPAVVFENETARNYLIGVAEDRAKRQALADAFGVKLGLSQTIAETAAPIVIDLAATALLTPVTGGAAAGVVLAKQGAKATAKGLLKASFTSALRTTAGETAETLAAKNSIRALMRKGTTSADAVEFITAANKVYGSTMVRRIGSLPPLFLTSANRAAAGQYGSVYTALPDTYTPEEKHDIAAGSALVAAFSTGVITTAFSGFGAGGLEDVLLARATGPQIRAVLSQIAGVDDIGNEVFRKVVAEQVKRVLREHGTTALKGIGKSFADEFSEEGLDQFVNTFITDAALGTDTPLLDRLNQSFQAAVVGGVFGAGIPVAGRSAAHIKAEVFGATEAQRAAAAEAHESVVQGITNGLREAGSPVSAEVVEAILRAPRRDAARSKAVDLLMQTPPAVTQELTAVPVEPGAAQEPPAAPAEPAVTQELTAVPVEPGAAQEPTAVPVEPTAGAGPAVTTPAPEPTIPTDAGPEQFTQAAFTQAGAHDPGTDLPRAERAQALEEAFRSKPTYPRPKKTEYRRPATPTPGATTVATANEPVFQALAQYGVDVTQHETSEDARKAGATNATARDSVVTYRSDVGNRPTVALVQDAAKVAPGKAPDPAVTARRALAAVYETHAGAAPEGVAEVLTGDVAPAEASPAAKQWLAGFTDYTTQIGAAADPVLGPALAAVVPPAPASPAEKQAEAEAQREKSQAEFAEAISRNYREIRQAGLPEEIPLVPSVEHPHAMWAEGDVVYFNPIVLETVSEPERRAAYIDVLETVTNEEMIHVGARNALTPDEFQTYVDSLTDRELTETQQTYYATNPEGLAESQRKLASENEAEVAAERAYLADERLRQHLQEVRGGSTSEARIQAYNNKAPARSAAAKYFRRAAAMFARPGYMRKLRPIERATVSKLIHEARRLELNYLAPPRIQFDPDNPFAGVYQLLRQFNNTGGRPQAPDTRFSQFGAAQDAEYLRLAQDPETNQEALQAMVDAAARAAGFYILVWQGVKGGKIQGDSYSPKFIGRYNDSPLSKIGYMFSTEREEAARYGNPQRFYLRANRISEQRSLAGGVWSAKEAVRNGADALVWRSTTDASDVQSDIYLITPGNEQNIKSADPVTYDDNGNVIPLSQRFQPESPDIRFSQFGVKPEPGYRTTRLPEGAMLSGPAMFTMWAYHGTPHEVDKFRLDRIGTGEGAQAYGWGLYFAGAKSVAEWYSRSLSALRGEDRWQWNTNIIPGHLDEFLRDELDIGEGEAEFRERAAEEIEYLSEEPEQRNRVENFKDSIAALDEGTLEFKSPGNVYTVELLPDDADFLDWDKPLSEQSDTVKAFVIPLLQERYSGTKFEKLLPSMLDTNSGRSLYTQLANESSPKAASEMLLSAGIKGIRYLDGSSRKQGEGSHNYVIFDENLVRILEKNGEPVENQLTTPQAAPWGNQRADLDAYIKNLDKFTAMLDLPVLYAGPYQAATNPLMKEFIGDTDPRFQQILKQHQVFYKSGVANMVETVQRGVEKEIRKLDPASQVTAQGYLNKAIQSTEPFITPEAQQDIEAQYVVDLNYADNPGENATSTELRDHEKMLVAEHPDWSASRVSAQALVDWSAAARSRAETRRAKAYEDSIEKSRAARISERDNAMMLLARISPELAGWITKGRAFIDKHSALVRDQLGADPKLQAVFDRNLGLYITRAYKYFDDPLYRQAVQDDPAYEQLRQDAMDVFEQSFVENYAKTYQEANPHVTPEEAKDAAYAKLDGRDGGRADFRQNAFHEWLAELEGPNPSSRKLYSDDMVRLATRNLKAKKNVPEKLRKFLGEYSGEGANTLIRSMSVTAGMANNLALLHNLRAFGRKEGSQWLYTEEEMQQLRRDNPKAYREYAQIKLASGNGSIHNPLEGFYAPRELTDALAAADYKAQRKLSVDFATNKMGDLINGFAFLSGVAMLSKTLLGIGYYTRNIAGKPIEMLAQGHLMPTFGLAPALVRETRATLGRSDLGLSPTATTPDGTPTEVEYAKRISLGIYRNGTKAQVIRDMIEGKTTARDVEDAQKRAWQGVKENIGKGKKWTKENLLRPLVAVEELVDAFYRNRYYEAELDFLKRARDEAKPGVLHNGVDLHAASDYDLERLAADRMLKTTASHSETLPLTKSFAESGLGLLLAPFLRYRTDMMFRVPVNTLKMAWGDLASSNPVIRSRGWARMIGFNTVVLGLGSAGIKLLSYLLGGVGEKEDESLRASFPEYSQMNSFFYFRTEDGLNLIDFTFTNPYSGVSDLMARTSGAFMRGKPGEALNIAFKAIVGDMFLDDQIFAGAVQNAFLENIDPATNKPIYEEGVDDFYTSTLKKVDFIYKEAFQPRILSDIAKGIQSWRAGSNRPQDSLGTIALNAVAPFRVQPIDPEKQFTRWAFQVKAQQDRIKQEKSILKSPAPLTEEQVRAVYRREVESLRSQRQQILPILRGYESLGLSQAQQRQILGNLGFGKNNVSLLMLKAMDRPVLTPDFESDLVRKGPWGRERLLWLRDEIAKTPRYMLIE